MGGFGLPHDTCSRGLERRDLHSDFLNPRRASWAFLFGDFLSLPFSAAMCALAWRQMSPDSWFRGPVWITLAYMIGLAAGGWFRYANDRPTYRYAGATQEFESPTKLVHDFVAYPTLFGGLTAVGLPVVVNTSWSAPFLPALVLAGCAVWLFMGLTHDTGLDPHKLHIRFDWARLFPHLDPARTF